MPRFRRRALVALFALVTVRPLAVFAQDAPAKPPVDAPALAALGPLPIGVADVEFVQLEQMDPANGRDRPELADRHVTMKVWYPAGKAGRGTVYHAAMTGEAGADVPFTVPGIATPAAPAAKGSFPLIILAHGYGNVPEALSWLGENLATKGYVVVAPSFRDPPINIRTTQAMSGPIARRPLDIVFITAEAQRRARAGQGPFADADPTRTALIGYSMGGYGVLTAAGAPLDPGLAQTTRGALTPYVAGGDRQGEIRIADLKAVVAISPPSDVRGIKTWAAPGVGAIHVPTFFIVGSQDHTVGYDPGVRTLFETETHAPRYLLTFREAGHSIALIGAPPEMRGNFWNEDWFEDPVWRKDRLLPIQQHFITAFLDRYVKGDTAKAAYIDGLVPDASAGKWADAPGGRYAGFSPGAPTSTIWKGFQPSRTAGLSLEFKPAN
ncbi:alpha/beta hydrolase family protein [Flavisphingomonas formosensis]|uniref:alpha/beta hydrolase family protein n=1 Tax=Flavisphingomonas formosensis TaxID=861534 RepID=UPI001E3EC8DB|nr:dienelactone hydrolase [Sphingomonas formosensis]